MSGKSKPDSPGPAAAAPGLAIERTGLPGAGRRITALAGLTIRETMRSRVLLGMTVLMCLVGAGTLLWPADLDLDRVVLVQTLCYRALTLFGLIAAVFLAGSALPNDIASKRIYAVATKPITRLELLLGKMLGLIGVMFIFMVVGAIITLAVTHVASARKSYAGGSYTIEVTAPKAEVSIEDGDPVTVERGQLLTVNARTSAGYEVTITDRDTSISGIIPEKDVTLHERTLTVHRVAQPAAVSVACTGEAQFDHNELLLLCDAFARGNVWSFDLSSTQIPRDQKDVDVRMRFGGLEYEAPHRRELHKAPTVEFVFRNDASELEVTKEVIFTFPGEEVRPVPEKGRNRNYYEQVFTLPRGLVLGGTLRARIADYSPEYPKGGQTFYGPSKTPTWHVRGFDAAALPGGQQTLHLNFNVIYTRGLDIVDQAEVTAVVTNPATAKSEQYPLHLRNKTTSHLHFPRDLVDEKRGVDVTLKGIGSSHRIGHLSKEPPLYLVLRPDWFWASTARSAFLIFLNLSLFTALAVAASTLLSAPVAILVTLVLALAGAVKDMMLAARGGGALEQLEPTAVSALIHLPQILLAAVPLALAPFVLSRRAGVRILLEACLAAAFTWLIFFSSVEGSTVLVAAICFTIPVMFLCRPGRQVRFVFGASLCVMALALLASSLLHFIKQTGGQSTTLQDAVGMWIAHLLSKALALAPGFSDFSSREFITRGWTVPWNAMSGALLYALMYMTVCLGFGYALFRKREFE
ncbi:MAG: hypothetical protein ABIF82_02635 [Planctomycetota bacterium]